MICAFPQPGALIVSSGYGSSTEENSPHWRRPRHTQLHPNPRHRPFHLLSTRTQGNHRSSHLHWDNTRRACHPPSHPHWRASCPLARDCPTPDRRLWPRRSPIFPRHRRRWSRRRRPLHRRRHYLPPRRRRRRNWRRRSRRSRRSRFRRCCLRCSSSRKRRRPLGHNHHRHRLLLVHRYHYRHRRHHRRKATNHRGWYPSTFQGRRILGVRSNISSTSRFYRRKRCRCIRSRMAAGTTSASAVGRVVVGTMAGTSRRARVGVEDVGEVGMQGVMMGEGRIGG